MATRLIEAVVPHDGAGDAAALLGDATLLDQTSLPLADGRVLLRIVVDSDHTEAVLDALEGRFASAPGFRAVLLDVEATLPRPTADEAPNPAPAGAATPDAVKVGRSRISREELHHRVSAQADITAAFVLTVCLSAIVAAVGILRDDLAVIIGAMVIAPLLGPNVALALGTTLADAALMRRALRANACGVTLALGVSLLTGWLLPVDVSVEAVATRTTVGLGDVVLALAAGSACAIAYTTAVPAALIGVMVAVALLPPTVVVGLLAASGELELASGALRLLATNVICINLAGIVTFLWQDIRPRTWWEADRARQATRRAIAIWLALLATLLLLGTLA